MKQAMLYIFLLSCIVPYAQIRQIHLMAYNSATGQQYAMVINEHKHSFNLSYRLLDSVSSLLSATAPAYTQRIQSVKNPSPHNDTVQQIIAEIDSARERHSFYTQDELVIQKRHHKGYVRLFNQVLKTAYINIGTPTINSPTHLVLDGTAFMIRKQVGDISSAGWVQSPTATSHPALYHFIHQTLNLYRQKGAKSGWLDVSKTGGY
jgi:hypothetical protein